MHLAVALLVRPPGFVAGNNRQEYKYVTVRPASLQITAVFRSLLLLL